MTIKRNIVANLSSNAWAAVMGFLFVPLYLRYIGTEGYGLIGFFATISSALIILDGGFGTAASRELAKISHSDRPVDRVRDLIRTVEWLLWGMALIAGAAFIAIAPWLTAHWLDVKHIERHLVTNALRLMGATLILQWPTSYYAGCVMSLQKQVGLGVINTVAATLRGAGAVLVLSLVSPTLNAFFLWQLFAAMLTAIFTGGFLWLKMPKGTAKPRFNLGSLRSVRRFAAGVVGNNILALVLTQVDKLILSKVLPLEQFGYYTLAGTLAALILRLTGPIYNALYPRMTQLVAQGDQVALVKLYHQSSQLMAASIVPFGMLLVFFGREVFWLWTGNAALAERVQWVVACLALGTMFNGLMNMPYGLQMAHGWTSLVFWQNIVGVVVIAPLTYVLATRFGLFGAAIAWPILNAGYLFLGAPLMFRRLLSTEKWRWYAYSIAGPIGVCALIMALAKLLLPRFGLATSKEYALLTIILVYALSLALSALLVPSIRQIALGLYKAIFVNHESEKL